MGLEGVGNKVERFAERAVSGVLILPGQPTISSYIRIQDGGKLPRQTVVHAASPFLELGLTGNTTPGGS